MELVSVAAVADNLVIGRDGELPWGSLPDDRRQYRALVEDSPVILGRRTFEAMVDDLPGRAQIVLSRSRRSYEPSTAFPASGVDEALGVAESLEAETAYVIGGARIYEVFQPHLTGMVLSRIPGEFEGDAYYPAWDEREWERVRVREFSRFTVEHWQRGGDAPG